MATDRIRLGDKARKRLFDLADQADLEPSFLLEYLITRHGREAIHTLSGQQGNLVQVSAPNLPCSDVTFPLGSLPTPFEPNQGSLGIISNTIDQNGASLTQQQKLTKWLESDGV